MVVCPGPYPWCQFLHSNVTIQSLSACRYKLVDCGVNDCLNFSTGGARFPLIIAAELRYLSIGKRPLEYQPKIDVKIEEADCRTALVYGIKENRQEVATHLINNDASLIKGKCFIFLLYFPFVTFTFIFIVFRFSRKI